MPGRSRSVASAETPLPARIEPNAWLNYSASRSCRFAARAGPYGQCNGTPHPRNRRRTKEPGRPGHATPPSRRKRPRRNGQGVARGARPRPWPPPPPPARTRCRRRSAAARWAPGRAARLLAARSAVRSSSTRFWNTPPREHDRPESAARGQPHARLGRRRGQPVVEAGARRRRAGTPRGCRRAPPAPRARVQHHRIPAVERQRISAPLPAVRARLELHRRLALVGASARRPQSAATRRTGARRWW